MMMITTLLLLIQDVEFKEIKFFEGGAGGVDTADRVFTREFKRSKARFIYTQVLVNNLVHNQREQECTMVLKYLNPDGSLFGTTTSKHKIPKDWDSANLSKSYGYDEPNNWTEGTYTVEVWFSGKKVGSSTFTIVDDRSDGEKNAEAASRDGEACIRRKDFPGAIKAFTRAVQLNPNLPEPFARRGFCYSYLGEFDRAIDDAKKCTQLAPKNRTYWSTRARYFEDKGDDEGALLTWTLAIEMNPDEVGHLRSRSDFYLARGEFQKAVADLTKAIELAPKSTWYYQDRARVHTQAGNFDAALSDFRLGGGSANAIAEVHLMKGDVESAVAAFDSAMQRDPRNSENYLNRARLQMYLHDYDKALADYTKAWELKPGQDNYGYNRGLALVCKGEYAKAIEFFKDGVDRAAAAAPSSGHNYNHTTMLQSLAHAQALHGQPGEALKTLDGLQKQYPNYTFAYAIRARHKLYGGDSAGARQDLEASARVDSADYPASHRIYVWMMLGDWKRAADEIIDYQNRSPGSWRLDWYKAQKWVCRWKLGERRLADQELSDYLTRTQKLRRGTLGRAWALFLGGKISEEQMMQDAEKIDVKVRDIEVAGALYFAGIKRLAEGDREGAKAKFEKCRETSRWFKYDLQDWPDLAWAELASMGEAKPIKPPAPSVVRPAAGQVVIVTRDGSTYRGKIESEDDTTIRIRTALSVFNLKKSDIDRIDR
jgi:tetratricopeptide (TPR) repeat protein